MPRIYAYTYLVAKVGGRCKCLNGFLFISKEVVRKRAGVKLNSIGTGLFGVFNQTIHRVNKQRNANAVLL